MAGKSLDFYAWGDQLGTCSWLQLDAELVEVILDFQRLFLDDNLFSLASAIRIASYFVHYFTCLIYVDLGATGEGVLFLEFNYVFIF